jgi:cell division protein FtsB
LRGFRHSVNPQSTIRNPQWRFHLYFAPVSGIVGPRMKKTREMPRSVAEHDRPKLPPRYRDNPWLRRALIFITCVLLADALFGDRGVAQTIHARREYQAAGEGLRRVQNENAALREKSRRLLEDPRAIEAVAREELGLIRPGEVLVVVKTAR